MIKFISNKLRRYAASPIAKATILISLALASAILAHAKNHPIPKPDPEVTILRPKANVLVAEQPRIDVVFALDTTGSMGGLLTGAKQKIWTIVNQMANANTTPKIRIGLIGYRDRGDQYVTKRFELTEDIDALYQNLQMFSAGGGGDGPESVNQALNEAVTQMSWSQDHSVYKVIFLVGDAPPHMDYQDDVPYERSVELATQRGIVINTIQCGNGAEAARIFASIAALAHGEFASISQDGAMVASHTPMDEELSALNRELAETVVAWGGESEKRELLRKVRSSRALAAPAAASRLSYFTKMGSVVNSGRADLIDALENNEVDLDDLAKDELSAEMQAMSEPEQKNYLRNKTRQRSDIKAKIKILAASRDSYLEKESRERVEEGKVDSFDDKLLGTIRLQAAEKGIVY